MFKINNMNGHTATKANILCVTSEQVDLLSSKWAQMFDANYSQELMLRLEERVENFFKDLSEESDEKLHLLNEDIIDLQREAAYVGRLLHKSIDVGERPHDMPLRVWQQKLDESIEELREELHLRRMEICELLQEQKVLCDELGQTPLTLLEDPLPDPQEMTAFRINLERLQVEHKCRMERLFQLRTEIKRDMKQLELTPQTVEEELLLNQANPNLSPLKLKKLSLLHSDYADRVTELCERIDGMRQQIKVLWQRLPQSDEAIKRRVLDAEAYTQHTYNILDEELQRCRQLRRQKLKTYIEQLRVEIRHWWDLNLKSEQERKRFVNMHNELYNEDLLELHELELEDLKSNYNVNKQIFELYAERLELWKRMQSMTEKSNDPNRFTNRGGKLLREERERKALASKLPKIEQQITQLVADYEKRYISKFLVDGENILEAMAKDWEKLRQAKQQQSSARKQAVKLMPLRTPLKNTSSTVNLHKTPSNRKHELVSKTTGNLNKRKLPNAVQTEKAHTPNVKRNLIKTLNTMNVRKPPLKRVYVLDHIVRRSSGLGRRSLGRKSLEKSRKPTPRYGYETDSATELDDENVAYKTFQQSIDSTSRSSVLMP
ncbi:protein regulator of cytokinesis 1-like [Drosophila busckii]|uniref:protein regulator of cytokinesis 1-like n=1 Tax=Drosophila busckii TaxID=30019 RepID=UPI00083EEE32|nr:protein regulator of cytokinesis 1-like [Drosophila busckii]